MLIRITLKVLVNDYNDQMRKCIQTNTIICLYPMTIPCSIHLGCHYDPAYVTLSKACLYYNNYEQL